MKALALAAALTTIALLGLSSAATAATIEVSTLEEASLNLELAGRLTFRSNVATIICDKTIRGHLNSRSSGPLALLGNAAGLLGSATLTNCVGGDIFALINLTDRAVSLSWVDIRNGVSVTLGANNVRIAFSAIGVRCLYTAELNIRAEVEAGGQYRERFELTTLGVVADPNNSIFCPRAETITLTGRLSVIRPALGIRVILS